MDGNSFTSSSVSVVVLYSFLEAKNLRLLDIDWNLFLATENLEGGGVPFGERVGMLEDGSCVALLDGRCVSSIGESCASNLGIASVVSSSFALFEPTITAGIDGCCWSSVMASGIASGIKSGMSGAFITSPSSISSSLALPCHSDKGTSVSISGIASVSLVFLFSL